MKTCPTCNRTYTDESLSFCLDDGTPLVEQHNQGYDPQATLFMAEPPNLQTSQVESRTTAGTPQQPSQQPPSPFSQQPTSQSVSPYAQQGSSQQASSPFTSPTSQQQSPYQMQPPTWQPPPSTPSQQPRKRSFLPWIIALIGLLVVGGLGIVLVIAIIASMNTTNDNNQNNENKVVNNNKNTNNSNNSNKTNVNNSNTVNTNNSNNGTTVRPDYLAESNLAANSDKGTETTVFEPSNKIYYVYKLDSLPTDKTFVCQLVVDSAPGYKTGDSVKADTTLKRNYSGTTYFFFTPGTGGWPKGTYHVELLEKQSDGSLEKLDRIDLTVE